MTLQIMEFLTVLQAKIKSCSLDAGSNHAKNHITGIYQNPNMKIFGKSKAVKLAEACSVTFNNMDQTSLYDDDDVI